MRRTLSLPPEFNDDVVEYCEDREYPIPFSAFVRRAIEEKWEREGYTPQSKRVNEGEQKA